MPKNAGTPDAPLKLGGSGLQGAAPTKSKMDARLALAQKVIQNTNPKTQQTSGDSVLAHAVQGFVSSRNVKKAAKSPERQKALALRDKIQTSRKNQRERASSLRLGMTRKPTK